MRGTRCLRAIGVAFLIAALLVSVLSVQVFAAGTIEDAGLSVAGNRVTEANKDDVLSDGGSVRAAYDVDANQVTLTLTNANITYGSVAIQINSDIPLVIELVGENQITATGSRECIYYANDLTIQGSGTLELNSAGGNSIANTMRGSGPSTLVISGVSSLTANGYYKGIGVVGGIRIENSGVSVSSAQGFYNSAFEASQGIEISGSTVTVTAQGDGAYGMRTSAGSVSLTDSNVEIHSVRTGLQNATDDITISGGTLILTVSEQGQNGILSSGALTIENGADVTATSTYPALYGAAGLTIADSRVQATATADLGIWTRGNLSISGDVNVVSNGIAMASGCTFTVTPAADSLLEVKAGTSEADATHIADSPFAAQTTLSRIDDAYCSIKTHVHTGGTATCVTAAVCSDCGQSYGMPDTANHTAVTAVAEKPATCTAEGNIAYWHCEDCGKYFSDAACTEEITQADTVLAVAPHSAVTAVAEKPATCTAEGNIAYWYCADCGKYFRDAACTEEITQADTVLAVAPHSAVTAVAEKPATCTEKGNIAYWHCADCGKYFSDAACTREITLENTVLREKGHQFENGVCTVCGVKDPNAQPPETGDEGESQTPAPEQPAGSGPQTGDNTSLGMWVFLLLAGMAGLTGTVYYRKKNQ